MSNKRRLERLVKGVVKYLFFNLSDIKNLIVCCERVFIPKVTKSIFDIIFERCVLVVLRKGLLGVIK